MTRTISRRQLFHLGGAALVGQSLPIRSVREDYREDLFYREDWLGEPWRTPEAVVLIHGNDESSIEWYGWVPRMAQEYRLIRPDLPGLGHSNIPRGFQYSLSSLAGFVIQVMDKAGVASAHIIGAKTGGSVAMRLAADYPARTRTLVVAGGPAKPLAIPNPSPIPQRDRLGSNASNEMIAYWNGLFSHMDREAVKGLSHAMSNFDLAREGVLQRIKAPTLVITADRTKMHTVEEARAYQRLIPDSRLVVIRSDAYHIAAANADECVTETMAFLKERS